MPIDQHNLVPSGTRQVARRPVYVPLAQIAHVPIPHEDDMDPDWRAEHEAEYAQFGGSAGYVRHLADGIRADGQQEWVELRPSGEGMFDIWDGNHRVTAAESLGLADIKAIIVLYADTPPAVLSFARVPLTSLITSETAMRETLAAGRTSDTPDAPVLLNARADGLGFEIADGHHRIAAAIRRGETTVAADIGVQPDPEPYQPPFYDFTQ